MTDYPIHMSLPGDQSWTLTARWIFPVEGRPLEQGTITISGERIRRVDPHGQRRADQDLGNAAILPGLVNAHTHLDLTGLRGKTPPGNDFTQWLRAVIAHRRSQSPQQIEADIKAGLAESIRYGTTLLGDISAHGASWQALSDSGYRGRAVVFYELLGLPSIRAQRAWAQARRWLRERPFKAHCSPGLSPHAPYSVHTWLFRMAAFRAAQSRLPIAIHVAETTAELELLEHRRGPFVDFLRDMDVWDSAGLATDIGEVLKLNKDVPRCLLVHGNYLKPSMVPGSQIVVYCPRTHAAFGHGRYPLRDYLDAWVGVALGTDSLASNPDLNMLAEACFVHEAFPELPGDTILRMATLWGAEGLGWQKKTGSLVRGKSADLVVVPLTDDQGTDPYELLWQAAPVVSAVLIRGQWVNLEVLPANS
ncbi:MAG TPA: amidohydrolase family protein [Gemmataceae bacterium]|jgi:cytosine/adenosine deaminase-related metal-dependent hydrolase|nr:amidohydrolase family protein [Gemmataceae bacterium]